MSLLRDFYTVIGFEQIAENTCLASLTIHKDHPVFTGHFPGNPVTPGVCMMQIIKELGEKWSGSSLQLTKARNVKFMAIINPEKNENIKVEMLFEKDGEDTLSIKSTTSFEDTVALKFSGTFQII